MIDNDTVIYGPGRKTLSHPKVVGWGGTCMMYPKVMLMLISF